jgi:hypothetical protein
MRIASPGPGNGCRQTNCYGMPSFVPSLRISSLKSSRKRFYELKMHRGRQTTNVMLALNVADGPLKDML